ncbi:MAG TPA: histidinol-phosphate transaminase [Candidatus Limnocylindrales bacterium]
MISAPVTSADPGQPASYSWEATDEGVADRFGLPVEQVVRFDLNTSPAPPSLLGEMLAAGRFETSLSEYPPGDYRHLVEAAADRYGVGTDEVVPGAGADEILDMAVKAFLRAGQRAVVPVPTYAMYRVVTEQRGGTVVPVPRLGPDQGFALDVPAVREAARTAAMVWVCNPNNPTGAEEPEGAVESLLAGIEADAAAEGRRPAAVIVDEAYAEFTGRSSIGLRSRYANLIVVRTASKAYALAGLRVGFAVATPPTLERVAVYRPPGSIGTISETVVTRALREPAAMRANVARVEAERPRLAAAFEAAGWRPYPSVACFVLVDLGSTARASFVAEQLLRRGLVPRTFPVGHPAERCLRVTVRAPHENDRLIEAIAQVAADAARIDTDTPVSIPLDPTPPAPDAAPAAAPEDPA